MKEHLIDLQNSLKKVKASLALIDAAPNKQALSDKSQALAENLLNRAISESEFREGLLELEYQRTRGAVLASHRPKYLGERLRIESKIGDKKIADDRAAYLIRVREGDIARKAEREARLLADKIRPCDVAPAV